ncbi:Tho complex subunit 7-domain-containing protein [Phanerochaete sordida]|uniref:Tho complex subunit 7-domain-containing protein n=1 Tax=Phanerochaete sordida TaxID=48140 RepID=A0A9P3FYZ4_9APHY|nr:Tho complex subunit 7-domain-containing protein [Phanerochaete sordida]
MTIQQEGNILHTRITNDEKALRRVTKKFHGYTSVAYEAVVPPSPTTASSVDDAREAFLVELASFHLSLKKSLMVCEAEARQVEEYQREKERIENERVQLQSQIDELKQSLEYAQVQRRRKMEYDVIAEKINAIPTREELEQTIKSLESDMTAVRAEHEEQTRVLQAQQSALDVVITHIRDLRLLANPDIDAIEQAQNATPVPEVPPSEETDTPLEPRTREETGEISETPEASKEAEGSPMSSKILNPAAQPFVPNVPGAPTSRITTPQTTAPTPTPSTGGQTEEQEEGEADDDDVEMGELAEEPEEKVPVKKKVREELEEGEASESDLDSELTQLSDD